MEIEVFKRTSENWSPSFFLNTQDDVRYYGNTSMARVRLHRAGANQDIFRVAVSGRDDIAMEKDFSEEEGALRLFLEIVKLEDVTFQALESLGLYSA